mgnify:CR=1 FL=1
MFVGEFQQIKLEKQQTQKQHRELALQLQQLEETIVLLQQGSSTHGIP